VLAVLLLSAGAATITGAGGRDDDAQALSSSTASTVDMRPCARDRPNPAIRLSAAPRRGCGQYSGGFGNGA